MVVESKYISFGSPWNKTWTAEASSLGLPVGEWPHRLVVIRDGNTFVFESETYNRDFEGELTSVIYYGDGIELKVYND